MLSAAVAGLPIMPGCDHDPKSEETDSGTTDTGTTETGTGGTTSGGETETGGPPSCPGEPVPVGPSLLDAGTCVSQATGVAIAECRPALTPYRPCDAAFLEWCNANGGDVEACGIDEDPRVSPECGGTPAFLSCDLTFFDACDALNGELVCDNHECVRGKCNTPPLEDKFCCKNATVDDAGNIVGDECKAVGNVGANTCKNTVVICNRGVLKDGTLIC